MDAQKAKIKMQYLQSIVYSNNELGLRSLNGLKALLPFLFELGLNNLHLEGGSVNGRKYNSSDVLEEILYTLAMEGSKLMKLKLTKMNLRSEGTVH